MSGVWLLGVSLAVFVAVVGAVLFASSRIERWLNRVEGREPMPASARARALHGSSFVVDLHADSLLWGRDLLERSRVGHVDLPRLREGGVALQVLATVTQVPVFANLYRVSGSRPDAVTLLALRQRWPLPTLRSRMERALHQARRLEGFSRASEGRLLLICSAQDLERLVQLRRRDRSVLGVLLGIEGAHALDGDPAKLRLAYEAGFRLIGLAHLFDNAFAGSAHGTEKGGLTAKGRELVREMDRLGVVVDLAHASARTIEEVLALVRRPPIVSHTGVRGTCPNPRNLSDTQVRMIAEIGGVIGIGFFKNAVGGTSPADIVRTIRYVSDLVGDEHVALGSDFDGAVATSFDASRLPVLTDALFDGGFAEAAIRRILGENALRVLRSALPEARSRRAT